MGMISRIYVSNSIVKGMFIKEEDYLKVVEEKDEAIKLSNWNVENYEKQLKEKEEEIEKLNNELIESIKISNLNVKFYEDKLKENDKKIEILKEANKYCADCSGSRVHINKLEKENEYYAKEYERMKNLYEPEIQYEEWCTLSYSYEDNEFNKKYFEQEMLLEDAYELIGMDSDNWRNFNVNKYKKEVK